MNVGEIAVSVFAIGFCTGLRCMTPICVLSLMRIPANGIFATLLFWPYHAIVFPLAAVGELIGDKLPQCPSRLAPPGLIGRILFGGFCGAALAASVSGSFAMGVSLGIVGALTGAFLGNRYRGRVPTSWAWPAALVEDAVAIFGSIFIVSRVH